MINTKELILNLSKDGRFSQKLNRQNCLDKLNLLLPKKIRDIILFNFVKHKTLYFAVEHQAYKMEVDYNSKIIRELINSFKVIDNCKFITEIEVIKTYIYTKKNIINDYAQTTKIFYKEKSFGNFENQANEKKIYQEFEKIRNIIKKK
jgi:hypothetical protein